MTTKFTLLLWILAACMLALTVSPTTGAPVPGGSSNSKSPSSLLPAHDLGNTLRAAWKTPQNSYPIVLVHGFGGFGKPLAGVLNYWGGPFGNTSTFLQALGYTVYVADLGPFSSNWERACELYAQIMGTRVDYGVARSTTYGFQRYGRDYSGKGFYPQWSATNKINFITHSMGGQTVEMLISLMKNGFPAEVAATKDGSLSPLFQTGKPKPYINSMLSISNPAKGTYLADTVAHTDLIKAVTDVVVGATYLLPGIYDTKLDHWGLAYTGGSFADYIKTLASSQWVNSKSNSYFDLSVAGQKDPLNTWVTVEPDVYYFSVSNYCTMKNPFGDSQLPTPGCDLVFDAFAVQLGDSTNAALGVDQSWFQNDGVVNTISHSHPAAADNGKYNANWGNLKIDLDTNALIFWPIGQPKAPPTPVKGVYQSVGPAISGYGHLGVTGTLALSPHDAYVIAQNAAAIVSSTP